MKKLKFMHVLFMVECVVVILKPFSNVTRNPSDNSLITGTTL